MTRVMRLLALVVMLAFGGVGCVQQGKPPAPKKIKRVAAAKKGPPSPAATKATTPSERDAKKPTEPEANKTTTPTPTGPGLKPPPPPPRPEMPVVKDIEPEKIGLPIYPGAEVLRAQERTWPKSNLGVLRMATLSSDDAPDKILRWYKAKLGAKAEVVQRDQKHNRRVAWVRLFDARTQVLKSVMVNWMVEEPGVATDVRVQLTVRTMGKKASD